MSCLGSGNEVGCELSELLTSSILRVPAVQAEYCLCDLQSQRSGRTIWMLTYLQFGDTSKHLQLVCVVNMCIL